MGTDEEQEYEITWNGLELGYTRVETITVRGGSPFEYTGDSIEMKLERLTKPTKLWQETLKLRWIFLKFRAMLLKLRVKYLFGFYDIEE